MDWQNKKRGSVSYSPLCGTGPYSSQRVQFYNAATGNSISPAQSSTAGGAAGVNLGFPQQIPAIQGISPGGNNSINNINNQSNSTDSADPIMDKSSYYFSQYPLYCADWTYVGGKDLDCVALSTYKEGLSNKLQIVHGQSYRNTSDYNDSIVADEIGVDTSPYRNQAHAYASQRPFDEGIVEGFDFHKAAEVNLDYPITNLQWDPAMGETQRLAASSEVLRLYKVDYEYESGDHRVYQTHMLANNTNGSGSSVPKDDINTFPPVTSFDWNKTDPNIIIASSVNTTCTVWDLNRSHTLETAEGSIDTATVKTQLIAHDSEVFDVKFVHKSSDIFVSVGNDGSMRLFDLRSLEHSTIIYEPSVVTNKLTSSRLGGFNQTALLKLTTSNVDQHFLATIGVNSNQIIVIDMRMPGMPLVTLDGSLGGASDAAINSIQWHPSSNYLLSGGDDCQALVWDCSQMTAQSAQPASGSTSSGSAAAATDFRTVIDTPILSYEEELEVNNVCWRAGAGDWMGVVSGKGFQAVGI